MLFKDHFNNKLIQEIKTCKECDLHSQPGPVLGYGGLEATVMFISDAPKEKECSTGVPFTGIAKERMLKAISDLGLKKGEYYFTYLIKHMLPEGSKPGYVNNKNCFSILLKEIELINPKIIVSMGFYVTKVLAHEYDLEIQGEPMVNIIGNGYIIPRKEAPSSRHKKRKEPRPKRYLVPTWSPAVDHVMQNEQFEKDIMTVKTVQNLSTLLFND